MFKQKYDILKVKSDLMPAMEFPFPSSDIFKPFSDEF